MSILKSILPYLLAVLSGVMISLGWITPCPTLVMLVAIVPLLFAEDIIAKDDSKLKLLRVALVGFVYFFTQDLLLMFQLEPLLHLWTYAFFFANSFVFAVLFVLFTFVKRKLGNKYGYVFFAAIYVTYEYVLLNIDSSFPALLLGAALIGTENSGLPFIQWYEYTGVLGGSLWVLVANVLVYALIKRIIDKIKVGVPIIVSLVSVIIVPIVLSVTIYYTYQEKSAPVNFVLVQPNLNPYTEKFSMDRSKQLDRMLSLAESKADDKTDIIVFPETALDSNLWYNNINENDLIRFFQDTFLLKYPKTDLLFGATMLQYYITDKQPSTDAMRASDNIYVQMYNSVLLVPYNGDVQAYKKEKLVPFVERNPFASNKDSFGANEMFSNNLAIADELNILKSSKARIGTFICYESIFGDICRRLVNEGADIFCTVTNDGWFVNDDIPIKHFRNAQLRAIENRRSLAVCGNTGITAGIDQLGRIVDKLQWYEQNAIAVTLNKNKTKTIYSQSGNVIGIISLCITFFLSMFFVKNYLYE